MTRSEPPRRLIRMVLITSYVAPSARSRRDPVRLAVRKWRAEGAVIGGDFRSDQVIDIRHPLPEASKLVEDGHIPTTGFMGGWLSARRSDPAGFGNDFNAALDQPTRASVGFHPLQAQFDRLDDIGEAGDR
jgi:hypothetical protein